MCLASGQLNPFPFDKGFVVMALRRFKKLSLVAHVCGLALVGLCVPPAVAQDIEPLYDRDRNVSVTERTRPDYEPSGIEVGSFNIAPRFEADVGFTDNVFADENNAESDTVATLRARIDARSTWSRHGLRLSAGAERTMYNDFPKSDVFDPFLEAEGRFDFGRNGRILGLVRSYEQSETWGSPEQPETAISPVEIHGQQALIEARYQFNRIRVSGTLSSTELDYDDSITRTGGRIDQDGRDRTERVATARAELALSPDTAVLAEVQINDRDYEFLAPGGISRNSTGQTYLVGANFDLTDLVRGEVSVGAFNQDYKDNAIGEISGLAANARVDWFPTERTTVSGQARRLVEEAFLQGARTYVTTEASLQVDHELRRNVIVSAGARLGQREYEGIDRDDTVRGLQVGATYLVNRRVSVQAGYSFDAQTSDGARRDRDYDINRGFVGVRVRL
jgi:hypothetical protein